MLIVSLILFQLVIFAVLIFTFRKVMTKNIIVATRHIEELNRDYAKKEQEIDHQLQETKLKAESIIKAAQQEAQNLKIQTIKEAENERDKIVGQARAQSIEIIQQADKARQALLQEIEERIDKEAVNKACLLLEDTLPEEFKQNVHLHWVEELIANGFSQLERLRIPQDLQEIKITSAFALNTEQRKSLFKKLNEVFGREITLKEEVDPKVVAGLIISMGSLVLDGSLKNKIKEKAKSG
ncbi:MAG: F0F1 ATP synthase subunit delta [Candidatus Omnitrophica bacterium]|nr:F0F1 ATP synthase subunit delta [Candidatus Omnitrophota bacterium]